MTMRTNFLSREPEFKSLYQALDIERPLDVAVPADLAKYVPSMHVSKNIDPIEVLRAGIVMSDRPGTWLFTGHRGVGKSTELKRMAARLQDDGHIPIMADMSDYLNLAQPIGTEALLLAIVAALSTKIQENWDLDLHEIGSGKRLWNFLTRTEIIPKDASVQGLGLSLKAELKNNPSFRERVVRSMHGSLGEFFSEVQAYAQSAAGKLRQRLGRSEAKVVVILDSLERLRITSTDAQICYDKIVETFDTNGQYLNLEHLYMVYSVPPYLPFVVPRIGSYFGTEVCVLPHVRVFEHSNARDADGFCSAPNARGIALMVQTVQKRYADVEALIPLGHLEHMALASSGSVRDFFRLVRSVCAKMAATQGKISVQTAVEGAEQSLRNEMSLTEEDKDWLREIHRTNGYELKTRDKLPHLAELFDSGMVLTYRNGKDWCDVQYLLQPDLQART